MNVSYELIQIAPTSDLTHELLEDSIADVRVAPGEQMNIDEINDENEIEPD